MRRDAPATSPRGRRSGLGATARRRRLTLVLSLAPGMVMTLLLGPTLRSPGLLASGLVLLAAGPVTVRGLARLGRRGDATTDPPNPLSETVP